MKESVGSDDFERDLLLYPCQLHAVSMSYEKDRYLVRPKGYLGTCGWVGGWAWQAIVVNAANPEQALRKVLPKHVWSREGNGNHKAPANQRYLKFMLED